MSRPIVWHSTRPNTEASLARLQSLAEANGYEEDVGIPYEGPLTAEQLEHLRTSCLDGLLEPLKTYIDEGSFHVDALFVDGVRSRASRLPRGVGGADVCTEYRPALRLFGARRPRALPLSPENWR